jgi:hypothetical protein
MAIIGSIVLKEMDQANQIASALGIFATKLVGVTPNHAD